MNQLVDHFMRIMTDQPLSLALCAMNFILLYFLFKQGNQFMRQRRETAELLFKWQERVQITMANCVSAENLELILKALERDRELYRALLPSHRTEVKVANEPPKVDETKPDEPQ